jgi:hypothetical protein
MPAYRAETTSNGQSPISRPELLIVSFRRCQSRQQCRAGTGARHRRSRRRTSATEETRRSCYTEALRREADIIVLLHPTTSTQRTTARTR